MSVRPFRGWVWPASDPHRKGPPSHPATFLDDELEAVICDLIYGRDRDAVMRAAFRTYPRRSPQQKRVRDCLSQLGVTDAEMRDAWKRRGEL